ncbi:MAG: SpoIIE family protein phosphatase [Vicinamibacterales bacterium]
MSTTLSTRVILGDTYFRTELESRRRRLVDASRTAGTTELAHLLAEVDAALDRIERGTYGVCDVCHDTIEADRLVRNPLTVACADHVSLREETRLARDLALAREVQRRLLPCTNGVAGSWAYRYTYLAAGDVGGDYCDVIPIPSRRETLVLLGDVAGKGVAASMLMSSLHATFRSLVSLGLDTGALLARANDLFAASAPAASYVTLLVAALQPDGRLDLYGAGHPPPLLKRRDTVVPVAIAGGVPLGMFPGIDYTPTSLTLAPDEALLFFTDGAVEAENPDGEDYGSARLARALRATASDPAAMIDRCLEDVASFVGGSPQDDLTLLALRRTTSGEGD